MISLANMAVWPDNSSKDNIILSLQWYRSNMAVWPDNSTKDNIILSLQWYRSNMADMFDLIQ